MQRVVKQSDSQVTSAELPPSARLTENGSVSSVADNCVPAVADESELTVKRPTPNHLRFYDYNVGDKHLVLLFEFLTGTEAMETKNVGRGSRPPSLWVRMQLCMLET